MESRPAPRRSPAAWAWLAVYGATFLAYWPVLRAGFIWDDDGHVTRPDLRSLPGLGRIWFEVGATQQYYPVLHSAFWVEHRLWGDAAVGYHLVNILLHATAACLFGVALGRLGKERGFAGWVAAMIFALHPVGVESVAWISEQKNTLSTVFYLLAGMAFLTWHGLPARAASTQGSPRDPCSSYARAGSPCHVGWYFLSLALFVLAVLSKSVTATLPAALLVVLWWRKGTLSWKRDFAPLAPFFAIGIAAGLFTAWVERTYIGAQGAAFDLGILQRVLLAGRIAWFYLGKLFWPANLMFVYPHGTVETGSPWAYAFPLGIVALLAALWAVRGRNRGPLAALLFFVGSLFPALGFFNVYPFVFSYVADHFQYLAMLGIVALVTGVLGEVAGPTPPRGIRRWMPGAFVFALLCILGVLTWRQCRTYRNDQTLYQTTVDRNPNAWLAQDNLGVILARAGRIAEAMPHYEAALRLNPNFPETYNNYGNALAQLGKWAEADAAYARALTLRPRFVEAEYDWGNALSDAGQYGEAKAHYENALRLRPDDPEALYRLGNALGNSGQLPEAVAHYQAALRLRPGYAEAHANLGFAFSREGRLPEAIAELNTAVKLSPGSPEAHAFLGATLAAAGRFPEAVAAYRRSLELNPRDADVHYQLGVALRSLGETGAAEAEFAVAQRLSAEGGAP